MFYFIEKNPIKVYTVIEIFLIVKILQMIKHFKKWNTVNEW